MLARKAVTLVACLGIALVGSAVTGVAVAPPRSAPGGSLAVGDVTTGIPATLHSKESGKTADLWILADEDPDRAGLGSVTALHVHGCSVHGSHGSIDFTTGGPSYSGERPEVECGTAGPMPVAIDGCTATIEFHGFAHVDLPIAYLGPATTDLVFKKTATGGVVAFTIFTPKGPIKFDGDVTGPISMDTCL